MPKVSVIIPIYKVEAFIVRCVNSLMRQTLSDIEYIFVNDATPDNSMALLQLIVNSYPERKEQVRIVEHEYNQGLPAARNSGLAVATGKYIFHCDSDDYMEDEDVSTSLFGNEVNPAIDATLHIPTELDHYIKKAEEYYNIICNTTVP